MRYLRLRLLLGLCACCALPTGVPCAAGEAVLKSGIDRSTFEPSVKPGDNFYLYVNGNWIKHNPIPPEYSRWGAFPKLRDDNLLALRELLDDLAKESGPLDADRRKLRDFYKTAMDEARLEAAGASPLAGALEKIAQIKGHKELITELARLHMAGNTALFGFAVEQDEKQSTQYAVYLVQGGLGLPERDYYVETTKDSQRIRTQYREHVAKMLRLLGDSPAAATQGADTVLRIETRLAEASRTPVQLRDREAQYNKKTLHKLALLTPHFDWDVYLRTIDAGRLSDVVVGQPEFFERVDQMVESLPIGDWQTYLRWHLVHSLAPYLNRAFEEENFQFYSGVLRGVKEMQPRWKRAITTIDGQMGEALGRLYVEKHFSPAAKERMDELVKNLIAAYRERILSRDWMGPDTKKQALAKLATVLPKIGYPNKWRDYSALEITPGSYAENVMRAEAFEARYRLSKLGKPVDRAEWHMTPPTVNAYYNPTMNEIVFPAGILQPPFFDPTADDAVNYGGIGAVIGHEITHGFDDQGSHYDADGNMKNWWTSEDRARFTAKTDKLVKEYNACVAVDDLHVNGRLTLGENLADLGGVTIAYAAYQRSLEGRPAPVIDGFTGPQRFFIGFAQVWRGSIRDADQRLRLRTDPHSPMQFRGTIPLSNIEAFYTAFDVKPGETLYRPPQDRVEVW
jgi:putative endopeptidase